MIFWERKISWLSLTRNTRTGEWKDRLFTIRTTDTNWNDYIFRTGFQHNHSLSASGGTDKSQYYVSLGFTEQEGIIRANDLNRLSLKADLTQQATKWLRIGLNGQMTRTRVNGVMNDENSLGGVGFAGTRMLPNVSVFNPDDPTGYNIDAENCKTLGREATFPILIMVSRISSGH